MDYGDYDRREGLDLRIGVFRRKFFFRMFQCEQLSLKQRGEGEKGYSSEFFAPS